MKWLTSTEFSEHTQHCGISINGLFLSILHSFLLHSTAGSKLGPSRFTPCETAVPTDRLPVSLCHARMRISAQRRNDRIIIAENVRVRRISPNGVVLQRLQTILRVGRPRFTGCASSFKDSNTYEHFHQHFWSKYDLVLEWDFRHALHFIHNKVYHLKRELLDAKERCLYLSNSRVMKKVRTDHYTTSKRE